MAFFIDASNIWYHKRDGQSADNPAVFNSSRFLSELAIGAGFGVRLNFNFFLIRFDFGFQMKDPGYPVGERWVWQSKDQYNQFVDEFNVKYPSPDSRRLDTIKPNDLVWVFNLAIGYPF